MYNKFINCSNLQPSVTKLNGIFIKYPKTIPQVIETLKIPTKTPRLQFEERSAVYAGVYFK